LRSAQINSDLGKGKAAVPEERYEQRYKGLSRGGELLHYSFHWEEVLEGENVKETNAIIGRHRGEYSLRETKDRRKDGRGGGAKLLLNGYLGNTKQLIVREGKKGRRDFKSVKKPP